MARFRGVWLWPTVDAIIKDWRYAWRGLSLDVARTFFTVEEIRRVLQSGGGLAVLNLEGVQTRFDDPGTVLARIAAAADGDVHALLAEAYQPPIREELIARRLEEIHAAGSKAAVAATPAAACSTSSAKATKAYSAAGSANADLARGGVEPVRRDGLARTRRQSLTRCEPS